jgi:hypothetical protein
LRQSRSAHPTEPTQHDATRTAHKARRHLANVCLQSIQFRSPASRLPAFVAKRSHFFLYWKALGHPKGRFLLALSRPGASANQCLPAVGNRFATVAKVASRSRPQSGRESILAGGKLRI